MSKICLAAILILAAMTGGRSTAEPPPRIPVLLELFTSEGCSSCPPADRLLQLLDEKQPVPGADVIVLSEHVDYWNNLGWKDPYSSSQFTSRQEDFAKKYKLGDVYTPQLVIDGRVGLVGSDAPSATAAIQKAIRERKLAIAISGATRNGAQVSAHIELSPAEKPAKGVLFLALADNRAESHVARGENAGRLLAHVAVARVLQQVGSVDLISAFGKDVSLTVPPGIGANGSRLIAFLQDPASGRILGVAQQRF